MFHLRSYLQIGKNPKIENFYVRTSRYFGPNCFLCVFVFWNVTAEIVKIAENVQKDDDDFVSWFFHFPPRPIKECVTHLANTLVVLSFFICRIHWGVPFAPQNSKTKSWNIWFLWRLASLESWMKTPAVNACCCSLVDIPHFPLGGKLLLLLLRYFSPSVTRAGSAIAKK